MTLARPRPVPRTGPPAASSLAHETERILFRATAALLAASALVWAAGCTTPEGDSETARGRAAVVGGDATSADPAVVMLVSYPPDHSVFETCTASVVSDTVVLTAAHCVDPDTHPGAGFGVFLGPDASAFATANTLIPQLVPIKEAHVHPDYDKSPPFTADIGVAVLEAPVDVAPLPVHRESVGPEIVGQAARIVGYGQIKYKEYNAVKHQASTSVAALDKGDTLTVGDKDHRSCVGDSGGPALVAFNGVEHIVGVDSYTDLAGCLDPAHYRRPDLYTSFLDQYVPPPSGTGGAGGTTSTATDTAGSGGASTSDTSGGCAISPVSSRSSSGAGALSFFLLSFLALARAIEKTKSAQRRSPP
ncbi:MAG: trypsin-like serine protease [Polyangiaceae bacterium]